MNSKGRLGVRKENYLRRGKLSQKKFYVQRMSDRVNKYQPVTLTVLIDRRLLLKSCDINADSGYFQVLRSLLKIM